MHDGPILTWRNRDPIKPVIVSVEDDEAGNDDDVAPQNPPLFLPLPPLPPNPIDLDDIDLAAVAPLPVVLIDVGAGYVQGPPVQGVPAPLEKEENIEGEVYEVIGDKSDANDDAEGEAKRAQCYNLQQPQQLTFASYDNPNGIEDLDLKSRSNDSNVSTSTADALEEADDSFDIHLTQIPATERSQERTFENRDKPRDMDEVRNMSYRFMVTQLMEHEGIAKHIEKAFEALIKEYAQLDEFNVFKPLGASSLTKEEKARPF